MQCRHGGRVAVMIGANDAGKRSKERRRRGSRVPSNGMSHRLCDTRFSRNLPVACTPALPCTVPAPAIVALGVPVSVPASVPSFSPEYERSGCGDTGPACSPNQGRTRVKSKPTRSGLSGAGAMRPARAGRGQHGSIRSWSAQAYGDLCHEAEGRRFTRGSGSRCGVAGPGMHAHATDPGR